nr:MAG TPA: hypothetical protein [Caudoviricetes sp.]DAS43586.1 MAG TPA: hypothetical protein [Caudoviricetes sp.]
MSTTLKDRKSVKSMRQLNHSKNTVVRIRSKNGERCKTKT